MFERFLEVFALTGGPPVWDTPVQATAHEWMNAAGGRTFEHGLYRVHTRPSARDADRLVRVAFPEFDGRIACFGYDWLGRQFATGTPPDPADDPEVLMFEPGGVAAVALHVTFSAFHDLELTGFAEPTLGRSMFLQWIREGGASPAVDECVGYRTPPSLGGAQAIANLELSTWAPTGYAWLDSGAGRTLSPRAATPRSSFEAVW